MFVGPESQVLVVLVDDVGLHRDRASLAQHDMFVHEEGFADSLTRSEYSQQPGGVVATVSDPSPHKVDPATDV